MAVFCECSRPGSSHTALSAVDTKCFPASTSVGTNTDIPERVPIVASIDTNDDIGAEYDIVAVSGPGKLALYSGKEVCGFALALMLKRDVR
jgi:hypothetical protein